MTPEFSILHPTIRLPNGWRAAHDRWYETASCGPNQIEYLLIVDFADDWESIHRDRGNVRIVVNNDRHCYVDAMNTAARAATGNWLISAADDWFPASGWDDELRRLIPDPLHTEALVNIVNGHHNHSIYPILTRAYYKRPGRGGHPNGEMFYPEYMSMGSDDDISRVARQDGVWIDSPLVFDHQHPWRGQPQHDTHDAYAHVQSNEAFEVGRAVQERRIKEGWIR